MIATSNPATGPFDEEGPRATDNRPIGQEVPAADDPELDLATPWPEDRRYKPRLMSRWLSPPQLIGAGFKELVAGLFEEFADRRASLESRDNVVLVHPDLLDGDHPTDDSRNGQSDRQALERRPLFPSRPEAAADDGFWFDYVADLGDGFSSTYSVASEIAMTGIAPKVKEYRHGGDDADRVALHRGDLLIMGGDQVYPLANDDEYRNRTVGPYETACRIADPPMSLLAVPGNHDWYDGLTAFLNRFCTEQWIGGWQTRQSRSYWAANIQPGWWVWGIDIALEHAPIDHHQLEYFRSVAAELDEGDRIILVTAKPSWLHSGPAPTERAPTPSERAAADEEYEQLSYFMWSTLLHSVANDEGVADPPRFVLIVSGDKHFYCRYDNEDAGDKRLPHVLAGGGGAYLSLPFRQPDEIAVPLPRRSGEHLPLTKAEQWPDRGATRRLSVTSLWRMISRNWGFCAVLAAIYLLLATLIQAGDRESYTSSVTDNVVRTFSALWSGVGLAAVGIGLVGALSLRSKLPLGRRLLLSVIQAALHLVALSICAALARLAISGDVGLSAASWATVGLFIGAAAWLAWGTWFYGIYREFPRASLVGWFGLVGFALVVWIAQPHSWAWTIILAGTASVLSGVAFAAGLIVAVALFGDQDNELSVAVRETGFKNFIRFHIDGAGDLNAYVIGLEKVPHQRLRFRPDGDNQAGTPEVVSVRRWHRRRGAARYEPRIIDRFTLSARNHRPTADRSPAIGNGKASPRIG